MEMLAYAMESCSRSGFCFCKEKKTSERKFRCDLQIKILNLSFMML